MMSVMRINAYAVAAPGGRAEPFSYERPLGDGDVLVRLTHCSIARGDVQYIDNEWGDTRFPLVPGHEIIGVVEAAGGAVADLTDLALGDRVGIGYQQSACFACEPCRSGLEQLCQQQKVIGVDCYGGAAEQIVVDGRFAFKLPPTLDAAASTPLLSSGLTVYAAIARAGLAPGSEAAVLGIGGLGHLAIQFLRAMGHRVSAVSHSPGKRASIEQLGATFIDASQPEATNALDRTFDFILSTLNASFDVNRYLRMLKPRGTLCFVAQPLEPMPISVGLLYDYAQRSMYGNYTGSRADMAAMLTFAAEHDVRSVVEIMPFADVNAAIDAVRAGTATRVVLQG